VIVLLKKPAILCVFLANTAVFLMQPAGWYLTDKRITDRSDGEIEQKVVDQVQGPVVHERPAFSAGIPKNPIRKRIAVSATRL